MSEAAAGRREEDALRHIGPAESLGPLAGAPTSPCFAQQHMSKVSMNYASFYSRHLAPPLCLGRGGGSPFHNNPSG